MNASKLEKIITLARLENSNVEDAIAAIKIKLLIAEVAIDVLHDLKSNELNEFFEKYMERIKAL